MRKIEVKREDHQHISRRVYQLSFTFIQLKINILSGVWKFIQIYLE